MARVLCACVWWRAHRCFGESALYSDEGLRQRQATVTCVREPSQYEKRERPPEEEEVEATQRLTDLLEWKGAVLTTFEAADIEALLGYGAAGLTQRPHAPHFTRALNSHGRVCTYTV